MKLLFFLCFIFILTQSCFAISVGVSPSKLKAIQEEQKIWIINNENNSIHFIIEGDLLEKVPAEGILQPFEKKKIIVIPKETKQMQVTFLPEEGLATTFQIPFIETQKQQLITLIEIIGIILFLACVSIPIIVQLKKIKGSRHTRQNRTILIKQKEKVSLTSVKKMRKQSRFLLLHSFVEVLKKIRKEPEENNGKSASKKIQSRRN